MWCLFPLALLLIPKAAAIPTKVLIFNATDGVGYKTSLGEIRREIIGDPRCQPVGTHIGLPQTPADPAAAPQQIFKIDLYHGPDSTPKGALYMRGDSLYVMGVAEQSGIVHYFPIYAPIFQAFSDSQPLPFKETYAGLTGTQEGDPVYPKLAQVQVGRAAAQNAMEFISRPDAYPMPDWRQGILTMVLMIPESLRIKGVATSWDDLWDTVGYLSEESALEMMAWGGLSQFYETGSLQSLSKRTLQKVTRLQVPVNTQEQAGNLIDLVFRLMPRVT